MGGRLAEQLAGLKPPRTLRFPTSSLPLADLLHTTYNAEFTGCIGLRAAGFMPVADFSSASGRASLAAGTDLLFLQNGHVVGLERMGTPGVRGVAQVLREHRCLDSAEAEAFAGASRDGLELCRQLEARGLVERGDLDIAVAEHARRRLFERAGDNNSMVDVRAGVEALAGFHPVHIDPRPVVAFGLVVHGSSTEKRAQMNRASGRFVRLVSSYDIAENAYRLPPPVLEAVDLLQQEGVTFGRRPRFRSLSSRDSAGLLLLMDRIGTLEIRDLKSTAARPPTASSSGARDRSSSVLSDLPVALGRGVSSITEGPSVMASVAPTTVPTEEPSSAPDEPSTAAARSPSTPSGAEESDREPNHSNPPRSPR